MLRQLVDRDPHTGQTRVRWIDCGARHVVPKHGRVSGSLIGSRGPTPKPKGISS